MRVSPDAFYSWRTGKTYRLSEPKQLLAEKVKEIFYVHRRRYGARRISADLKAESVAVGRKLAGTLMKRQNLTAIRARRFVPQATDSRHDFGYSPNLLKDTANRPSEKGAVLVDDITHLPLQNGKFCYLATFQDKLTRRVVGWQVSHTMTTQLVVDAFNRARRRGLIGRRAIIHTDRGSQYASVEYRRLLVYSRLSPEYERKGKLLRQCSSRKLFLAVQGGIIRKRQVRVGRTSQVREF